jgi:hypothetical protein
MGRNIKRTVVVKFIVIFFIAVLFSHCRTIQHFDFYSSPSDKIETMVIIGFGKAPKYLEHTPQNISFYRSEQSFFLPSFKPGDTITFFCYAVHFDNYFKPIENLELNLSVVNSLGKSYKPSYITTKAYTDESGYNSSQLKLVIDDEFTYRIRVAYKDKNTTSIGYSPNIKIANF